MRETFSLILSMRLQHTLSWRAFCLVGLALVTMTACTTNKYLEENQSFLVENEVVFEMDGKIKKKGNLKTELAAYYRQKPNDRFLWVPKEWFYYNLQDTVGSSRFAKKWKSWQFRQFGEEPSIFSRDQMEETALNMQYYLQHKGYLNAEVEAFAEYSDRDGKKIGVTYEIHPKQVYLIDTVRFFSKDPRVNQQLQETSSKSKLKKGEPLDVDKYEEEVKRITQHLRNEGYAYFQSNYIKELEADSAGHLVSMDLEVVAPFDQDQHQQYRVGNIYIYPTYKPSEQNYFHIDQVEPGVYFVRGQEESKVKPKTIINSLYFDKGELYRQEDYDRTYVSLGNLGVYRFVSIKEVRDTVQKDVLHFNVYLTPNKRFQFGLDGEVNTSNSPYIGRQLVGLSTNLSLIHRNIFKGAERLVGNLEGGVDLNTRNLDSLPLINTFDFRVSTDLFIPKFVDYLGTYRLLHKVKLINQENYDRIREKGTTRLNFTYNYIQNIDFYTLNSLNAGFGYNFRGSRRTKYTINQVGIDYLSPVTTLNFDTLILDQSPFLQRSFTKQLFTSVLLRDLSVNFTQPPNLFGQSYSILGRFELSGLEVFGANWIYNEIRSNPVPDTFSLRFPNDTVSFSQFIKLELDYRNYRTFSPKKSFVWRLYAGVALPFGYSNSVPYVKQFFVGGPQSIRAWAAREIGPGGYRDPLTFNDGANSFSTIFYQTGDIKLEFNLEYRFEIFSLFGIRYEGAVFLDGGNVYTLQEDPARPLSQFLWNARYDETGVKTGDNFLQYLALGTGAGLRLDFSYFIFRLDVGMRLRNPYPTLAYDGYNGSVVKESHWADFSVFRFRDLNYNIGLGYPF